LREMRREIRDILVKVLIVLASLRKMAKVLDHILYASMFHDYPRR
jgi:hypothetical protein